MVWTLKRKETCYLLWHDNINLSIMALILINKKVPVSLPQSPVGNLCTGYNNALFFFVGLAG